VDTLLNPELKVGLDAYTSQTISVNAPFTNLGFSGPVNRRLFEQFTLEVDRLEVEQAFGPPVQIEGPNGNPVAFEQFPAHILTLAGRTSSLQIFLDDAMLSAVDNGFGGFDVVFDRNLFELVNFTDDGTGLKLVAHISDYLVFDITNVPNKPTMSNSVPATRVWFSGDSIALSGDVGSGPEMMEVLTALGPPIEGLFSPPVALPGGVAPGTYSLRQIDPRDLSNLARITALQGTWRNYFEPGNPSQSPFLDLGPYEVFTFPQSIDEDKHDLVAIARNGAGQIISMYFGQVDFGNNTFSMWPIDQADDGSAANEITGTVSGFVGANGGGASTHRHIRSGNITITNAPSGLPAGFSTTGRFNVYRL
jgi:hypothetical protein